MKIQYIGNFSDGTGWAKASTYNVLSLVAAGYDVYCKEIRYNDRNITIEDEINSLLSKTSDDFDVIIHHVLPKDYKYIGGAKNIGFVELETLNLSDQIWLKNLSMMDEILVPNEASKKCLINSGCTKPIKIFNHSFNYNKVVNSNSPAFVAELNNKFNFIFVGEFSKRKNPEALVRAFQNEFHYIEPVNLVIKTNTSLDVIGKFTQNVKRNMKNSERYKTELIISDYLPEDTLWAVMKQCHAFVMPSCGEAWCYPAMEAMALGLPIIYTEGIGIEDYANTNANYAVKSTVTPCYGAVDTFDTLYTAKDLWHEIDIIDLQMTMRNVYEMHKNNNQQYSMLSRQNINNVQRYDFNNTAIARGMV
jgi:glycosyltransferase involved in cell wall biosynthesis